MAEPGTLRGEVQRGWSRFWGLGWRWKGPILAVVALVVVGVIVAATSGGSNKPKQADSAAAASQSAGSTESAKSTNTPKPSDTPKPTNTPKPPTATPTPAPPTATPEPAGYSFGSGKKLVGSDVQVATYRTRASSDGCYWERLKGLGGTLGEIAANDNAAGPVVVTISSTDVAFNSHNCAKFTQDLSAITKSATDPFGEGTYIVGVDIASGVWKSDGAGDCYWQRMSNFSGDLSGIIANDNATGPTIVQIGASDKGFLSHGCGNWTKAQ